MAQKEDKAIWRPVFSEWLKTGNEPRDISRESALERIGCNVRVADMHHGEMVNPQASGLSSRFRQIFWFNKENQKHT